MESKRLIVGLSSIAFLLGTANYIEATKPTYEVIEIEVQDDLELLSRPIEVEPQEIAVEVVEDVVEEVETTVEVATTTFRVTAYCPCEICCGKWGKNRPTDENGEPIVIGASGNTLVSDYSVASPMAFGTRIELDGIGVVEVQDRTAQWIVDKHGQNIIDLYMTDHQAAKNFGVKYIEGVIL